MKIRKTWKKAIPILCSILFLMSNFKTEVKAQNLNRRNEIKSKGNINFESKEVFVTAADLIYLADEIDTLESTYKCTLIDALNSIGTYFKNDGSITYDSSQNEINSEELKTNLSFGNIKQGILNSQSVGSLFQIQAADKDGNLLYYQTEEAQANKDSYFLTTTDTGFPAFYQAANADNLSAGTAAWVDGTLIKGNGSDNAAYYTKGWLDGQQSMVENLNISYTYHYHSDECYESGTCTMVFTETSSGGKIWANYHHRHCGQGLVGAGDWRDSTSGYSKDFPSTRTHEYSNVICGYDEGQILSATIIY